MPGQFAQNYPLKTRSGQRRSNTTVAAFAQDYEKAGELMEADLFHGRYKKPAGAGTGDHPQCGHQHGGGSDTCGAGPTVMNLVDPQHIGDFVDAVQRRA